MKIKRFVDKDMRQVLRRVREDQGPDAVILSTRRVEDGIEVIAAVDYDEALVRQALSPVPDAQRREWRPGESAGVDDRTAPHAEAKVGHGTRDDAEGVFPRRPEPPRRESTAAAEPAAGDVRSELSSLRSLLETQLSGLLWKDHARRSPLRAQILRNLARIGLAPDIAARVADGLEPVEDVRELWRDPLVALARIVPVMEDRLLEDGGNFALVGPTGVGKTTTIAKLAARHALEHGAESTALVSTDSCRLGAREQLETIGRILGVPVHAAADGPALTRLLDQLAGKRLVLIDTEGVSQRDPALPARFAVCAENAARVRFYLTLAATAQEAALDETVRRFSCLPLAGAVVTKIDEAAQLGCVLGTLIRHRLHAAWLADGQRIPDDLHSAERKKLWLVGRAVECMEISEPRIDERTMAESYGQACAAHA